MVEDAYVGGLALEHVELRRIEAKQHHLDALKAHNTISLGPSPIVADAHPHDAAHRLPHREAEIAYVEIPLLEMLPEIIGPVVGMARQMHLAVFADDLALVVDQDRRVIALGGTALLRHLAIAEVETDPQLLSEVENRLRNGSRHLAFEIGIDLVLVLGEPAREKSGKGHFGKHHETTTARMRFAQQLKHPLDDGLSRIAFLYRPKLGGACDDDSPHYWLQGVWLVLTRLSERVWQHERKPRDERDDKQADDQANQIRHHGQ